MTKIQEYDGAVTLKGDFINLRPLLINDASVTLAWRLSERARWLNSGATSIEEQQEWIEIRPPTEANFIIELKDATPIGMLSLIEINKINRNAETARFLIGDEKAAKGIPAAVEAMKLLYEFAFEKLSLIRLYGIVSSGNQLMVKWQKYLGMQEEGRLRKHLFIDGEWQDAIALGILYDEFKEKSLPRMNALISAGHRTS